LVTAQSHPLSISLDKGKTWTALPPNLFNTPSITSDGDEFNDPIEDKNGNLYVTGQESETIYKSADGGKSWASISNMQNEGYFAFYIDNNNWFYKSAANVANGWIYISKDNGATYSTLYTSTSSNTFFENMSVQSDGNFYFTDSHLGLYQGIGTSIKEIYNNSLPALTLPYIVAKNNNVITVNLGANLIAYYKK